MELTVKHNQSLIDLAVQQYGAATAAFDLAVLNGGSITDDMIVGETIQFEDKSYGESLVAEYYKNNDLAPATAFTDSEFEEIQADGIGEMIIEQTFIVR